LLIKLPSSQASVPTLYPSPQVVAQVSLVAELPPRHFHPDSIWQRELQPSPFILLPSSQGYYPKSNPSPHISMQVSGFVDVPPEQV
jgi:hypothetical protein